MLSGKPDKLEAYPTLNQQPPGLVLLIQRGISFQPVQSAKTSFLIRSRPLKVHQSQKFLPNQQIDRFFDFAREDTG